MKTTTISVFPDQPHAAHFQTEGEQVTQTTGVVKKAKENEWLIFHIPSRRPIDGYYLSHDSAVDAARDWSRAGAYLQDRLSNCHLVPRGEGNFTLRWKGAGL